MMNTVLQATQPTNEFDLENVIEPLASLICAADQPAAALKSALSMLYRHVEKTNELASRRIALFSGRPVSERADRGKV